MQSLNDLIWHNGKFLGIAWSVWKVVGWLGNAIFFSRFFVQWYATEKKKQVVIPQAFWWLSLIGSVTLLCYSLHQKDSVFIFAYAFTWIPYIRSLMIHRKNKAARITCTGCGQKNSPQSNFCPNCGVKVS
ncbi:MAG: lipid-A-disaccharide synthase N-terminal domain-containing protein [Verrucomicrobiae bacterium]|jgi:hypothetical protein